MKSDSDAAQGHLDLDSRVALAILRKDMAEENYQINLRRAQRLWDFTKSKNSRGLPDSEADVAED